MKKYLSCLLLGIAALASTLSIRAESGPQLGLQTWTCRNMTFEQAVDFAAKHGIKYVQFTSGHLNPKAPIEETRRKQALLAEKGVQAYTFGVAATGPTDADNRPLFEFAKAMGIKFIVVEPKEQSYWDSLEKLVKEYDIKLAIHNHGTGSVYGDPATIKKILAERDPRIGVCLDVGWVTAAGFDAAKVFTEYGDRVWDIHFKDKTVEKSADGKLVPLDTEIGKGHANYAGLFEAIKQSKWSGVMAIETDSKAFAEDPNRLVAEAKAFFTQQTAK